MQMSGGDCVRLVLHPSDGYAQPFQWGSDVLSERAVCGERDPDMVRENVSSSFDCITSTTLCHRIYAQ